MKNGNNSPLITKVILINDEEIEKELKTMKYYTTEQIFRCEFIIDPFEDKEEALDEWGHKIKWYDETEVRILLQSLKKEH